MDFTSQRIVALSEQTRTNRFLARASPYVEKQLLSRNVQSVSRIVKRRTSRPGIEWSIETWSTTAQAGASAGLRRQPMLIRRPQALADLSPEASLRLAAAWSGAVGGLFVVVIVVRLFS